MKNKKFLATAGALLLLVGSTGLVFNNNSASVSTTKRNSVVTSGGYATISENFTGEEENVSGLDADHPFYISNENDLARFIDKLENHAKEAIWSTTTVTYAQAYYEIEYDMDMTYIKNFKPLFSEDVLINPNDYSLTINGGNHTIRNICITTAKVASTTNQNSAGFFAVFAGTIRDLSFEYTIFQTHYTPNQSYYSLAAGGVAGVTTHAVLNNVHVTYNSDLKLTGLKHDSTVTNSEYNYYYVGGLVGFAGRYSTIINSTVDGNEQYGLSVSSYQRQGFMGALTGAAWDAKIYNCSSNISSLSMTLAGSDETAYESEFYLGLVSGFTYRVDYRNIYNCCGSTKSFTSDNGECSYFGLTLSNNNLFDKVYVNDQTGKTTEGNNIVEYTSYKKVLNKDGYDYDTNGYPQIHVGTYDDTQECGGSYAYELTNDTTVQEGTTYYTYSGGFTFANPTVYTAVTDPTGNPNENGYLVPCTAGCIKFKNSTKPVTYRDKYMYLADALNAYIDDLGVSSVCDYWHASSSLNNGYPFIINRFLGRVFSISYIGEDTKYEIVESGDYHSYAYGTEYVLPTNVTKETGWKNPLAQVSYEFEGWYTSSDLSGGKITSIAQYDYGNYTLYANFTEKTNISTAGLILAIILGVVVLAGITVLNVFLAKHRRTFHKKERKNNYPF